MSAKKEQTVLGIDLGTTNSVVAVADGTAARTLTDPDGNRLIPSCVSFPPDGAVLVGHAARERRLVDAQNTVYSIKRLIGRPYASGEVQRAKERFPFALEPSKTGGVQIRARKGTYALAEISAMVLRHLRKVAESALGTECSKAVITVPANFNELQRSATQAAGKVAGLEVMRILNEPTAATLAYGYGKDKPETVAVYDLGGGTFDITILDLDGDVFEVVSTAGDTFLGGDDVDLAIAERMAEECKKAHGFDAKSEPQVFERMRAAAEWAKCQLSSVVEAELTLEELFAKEDGTAVDFQFKITQGELEGRIRPLVARSFDVVEEALRESGRRPKEIDSVVLVGGSTRIPLVRQMVESFFGAKPRIDIDPDLVVAQGAAIHGWTLAGRPQGADPGKSALAKIPLPKITVADLKKKKGVTALGERLPVQPAFAPEESPLELAADPFAAPGPRRPTREGLTPAARNVAVIAPPTTIGGGEPGLLELDDPTLAEKPSRPPTRDPSPPRPAIDQLEEPLALPEPSAARALAARGSLDVEIGRRPDDRAFAATMLPSDVGGQTAEDAPTQASSRRPDTLGLLGEVPAAEPRPQRPDTLGLLGELPPATPSRPEAGARRADDLGLLDAPAAPKRPGPPPPPPPAAKKGPPPPPPLPAPREPAPVAISFPSEMPPGSSSIPISIGTDPPPPPDHRVPPGGTPPARALAPRIAELPLAKGPSPLLMDVTPLSLGLETAGGFCQAIVPRNAPVPAEKSRMFSTGKDDQSAVEIRICQGESIKFAENQLLGTLVLDGLRKAPRGKVRVEVTFLLDASGILDVRATDLDTRRMQSTRIQLQGGIDAAEIEAMRTRQERELAG
jgi:molecular chaperone DnaK